MEYVSEVKTYEHSLLCPKCELKMCCSNPYICPDCNCVVEFEEDPANCTCPECNTTYESKELWKNPNVLLYECPKCSKTVETLQYYPFITYEIVSPKDDTNNTSEPTSITDLEKNKTTCNSEKIVADDE